MLFTIRFPVLPRCMWIIYLDISTQDVIDGLMEIIDEDMDVDTIFNLLPAEIEREAETGKFSFLFTTLYVDCCMWFTELFHSFQSVTVP